MIMLTSRFLKTLLLGASALAFASAGHAAEGPAGHIHSLDSSSIGEPGKATATTRTIQIKLIDIAFEPESVTVKAGETVRFVLTNTGQMLHEFNLGTAAMHAEHQKEMALMAQHGMITATGVDENMMKMDHGNMPGTDMRHDDPNTVLVAPGEKKELVWKFSKPVDLEFACNIPGHYESGMVGKIEFNR